MKKEGTVEARTRIENIEEFLSVAVSFEERNPGESLEDFLASVSLLSDVDKTVDADNVVTMMTVHSAKGLEFKSVFLVGMEEGLFPISRSLDNDEDLEEERRLCYVAVTRAEEQLFITNAKRRMIYGRWDYALPSRFIEEMEDTIERKEKAPRQRETVRTLDYTLPTMPSMTRPQPRKQNNLDAEVSVGTKVKHKKWGEGMIVQIAEKENDKEISVAFDKGGIKRLSLSLAPIEIL